MRENDLLIKYAMYNVFSQLFESRYQLYLPNDDELRKVKEWRSSFVLSLLVLFLLAEIEY